MWAKVMMLAFMPLICAITVKDVAGKFEVTKLITSGQPMATGPIMIFIQADEENSISFRVANTVEANLNVVKESEKSLEVNTSNHRTTLIAPPPELQDQEATLSRLVSGLSSIERLNSTHIMLISNIADIQATLSKMA